MSDHGRHDRHHRRPAGRGPHERRRPAAEDERDARRPDGGGPGAPTFLLPYAAIGGAGALLVLALILAVSRSWGPELSESREPPPVRDPAASGPRVPPVPSREEGGAAGPRGEGEAKPSGRAPARRTPFDAMCEVKRFETAHPKDMHGAIARYETLIEEFPGTPEAGMAQMNVVRLKSVAGLLPKAPSADTRPRARIPPDSVEFQGRLYRVYRQARTWDEARALCRSAGGHLATITSRVENEFVRRLAREAGASAWIGLSDRPAADAWAWVTGEEVTYTAWAPGMPNLLQGVEQHVCLWKRAGFAWDDHSGLGSKEKRLQFVCEWEAPAVAVARPAAARSEPAEADSAGEAEPGETPEALAPLLAGFDSRLKRHDYAGAKKYALGSAGKAKGKATAEALRSAARVAGLLESRRKTMLRAARELVGQKVRIETEKGTQKGKLVEVSEVALTIAIQMKSGRKVIGETRMPLSWEGLTARQEDSFAKDWKPEGPEGALARAAIAIERADAGAAEREIESAGGHPLAEHFARKAEALRLKEAETDALAAWELIERWAAKPQMTLQQAKSLLDLTAGFEERHGQSRIAAEKRDEILAGKTLARRTLVGAGLVAGAVDFEGHRYKLYRYPTRWTVAREFCERLGGHLATVTSDAENDFLTGLARKAGTAAWIGLTGAGGEPAWQWVTGEKAAFERWAGGRPGRARPYAFIQFGAADGWAAAGPEGMGCFVCEWEPPRPVQPPAPSASEALFVTPPGHGKAVLYAEGFDNGAGGWSGRVVKDAKDAKVAKGDKDLKDGKDSEGGSVLQFEPAPDGRGYAARAIRRLPKGITITPGTRTSFRYRTEGEISQVSVLYWIPRRPERGVNIFLVLPPCREWARVDFPAEWLRGMRNEVVELAGGKRTTILGMYAGARGQEGTCFVDDCEVYDVVPLSASQPRRAGDKVSDPAARGVK